VTEKQKEEIKALVDQEFQAKKEQLKKEILEELGRNQGSPKGSLAPNIPDLHVPHIPYPHAPDPQLKLLK